MGDNNLTTEKKLEMIRKISALADGVTLEYIKGLSDTIYNQQATDDEKQRAFAEIDKVLKIAKQYSERVLLAEGKNTANVSLNGGGLPFKVTFVETVESPDIADKTDENHEDISNDRE